MSYFLLLSNPVRPGCRAFRNSGAGIHWLRYTAAALHKISHASGPGRNRTAVQTAYSQTRLDSYCELRNDQLQNSI